MRRNAEQTKNIQACAKLRKAQAVSRREVKISKRASFKGFIKMFVFKKDGPKAHKFISSLNNDNIKTNQSPLKHGN